MHAVWEMFHCEHAFEGMMEGQICLGVCDEALRPTFSPHCPLPYLLLTKACWHADASHRHAAHPALTCPRESSQPSWGHAGCAVLWPCKHMPALQDECSSRRAACGSGLDTFWAMDLLSLSSLMLR